MKSWVVAVGLLSAALCTGAKAADLDEGPADRRSGSAYDDPRYAEMYRYPDPAPRYREPRPYDERYGAPPIPRDRVYDEDEREGYREPRQYSYADPHPRAPYAPYAPYASRCMPHEQIHQQLLRQGWGDMEDAELRGAVAMVHARRPNGRRFVLTIDRCSGEVVEARPLFEGPARGPYAYDAPPRWNRPY
jgi:hypothetical protein